MNNKPVSSKEKKIAKITIDADLIRKAIVMRRLQKKFFEAKNPVALSQAKAAEKAFDALLDAVSVELEILSERKVEDASPNVLL